MKTFKNAGLIVVAFAVCAACYLAEAVQIKTATVYSSYTNTVEGDGKQCIVFNVNDEQHIKVVVNTLPPNSPGSLTGVTLDDPTITNSLPATSETSFAASNTYGATWKSIVFATSNAVAQSVTYPNYFKQKNSTYKIRLRSSTALETNIVTIMAY